MARPIPRPEPVTSATWSLSSIRTTRIEGRKRRGKQASRRGPHPFPTRWPRTVPQFRCNSPSANLIWLNSFFWVVFQIFLWAAFYGFAKLVEPAPASRYPLRPAAEFKVEVYADAANPVLLFYDGHSAFVFLCRVWRLLRHWFRKWERTCCPICHHTACESNGDRGADRQLQRRCFGYGASQLSVAKERRRHHWRHVIELYDARHRHLRQRRDVPRHGE